MCDLKPFSKIQLHFALNYAGIIGASLVTNNNNLMDRNVL